MRDKKLIDGKDLRRKIDVREGREMKMEKINEEKKIKRRRIRLRKNLLV